MSETISFPNKLELHANAENVTLTMLVGGAPATQSRLVDENALHRHAHAELFACIEGAIHLQLQDGMIALHAGDVAIVPPGLLHCMLSNPSRAAWTVVDFLCSARRRTGSTDLMQQFSPLFHAEHLFVVRDQPHLCQELARITQNATQTGDTWPALRFCALLSELCTLPMEHIGNAHVAVAIPASGEKTRDIDRIARLDHLINVYYFMSDLTLSRAAELLFVSTRQLERITHKEYGRSFGQLLCEIRLRTALTMLADTALTIGKIAATVGFSSRAAFCRAFASEYGETPSEYRKKLTRQGGK